MTGGEPSAPLSTPPCPSLQPPRKERGKRDELPKYNDLAFIIGSVCCGRMELFSAKPPPVTTVVLEFYTDEKGVSYAQVLLGNDGQTIHYMYLPVQTPLHGIPHNKWPRMQMDIDWSKCDPALDPFVTLWPKASNIWRRHEGQK